MGRASGLTGAINEYHQYDNRAGTYLGLDVHYLDRVTLEGLHYDNHANPAAEDEVTGELCLAARASTPRACAPRTMRAGPPSCSGWPGRPMSSLRRWACWAGSS